MPSINILEVEEECDISDVPRVENLVENLKMIVSQFLFSFPRRNDDFGGKTLQWVVFKVPMGYLGGEFSNS